MEHTQDTPTPRTKWVAVGDRCVANRTGWTGVVLRIYGYVGRGHIPAVAVRWDKSGSVGRHPITTVQKA
jgi:hypothetical protein